MVRRDEEETVPEKDLYSGKEGNGLSFEKLDEKMQSWGRKKFGDRYARDLWRNELLELKALKLGEDELYDFAFNIHCSEVYDMLSEENSRQADGLFYILLGPFLDRGLAKRVPTTTEREALLSS